ncbi:hypothetical protein, partial [Paracoccus yeei]|uniref:hypothetical protein n=1 Tax=Paracoccus yeei TaxID=147645 RepID=UPI0039EFEE16
IAEQRPARLVRPAHHNPRRYHADGESCSQTTVEAGLFQRPVKPWLEVQLSRIPQKSQLAEDIRYTELRQLES